MRDRSEAEALSNIEPARWQRLSHHLDEVLELPEIEWSGYLAALNRDDPVTATNLERLLDARQNRRFGDFLSACAPTAVPEPPAHSLVGRQVGPYVIEAELGRGGTGSVWRARRADGRFEGHVAIKLLHLIWMGRAGEQRFLLEGRLLAQLDHPSIARLVDAGMLEGGQPYLALEYIEGAPIDLHCDRAALDVNARVRLFLSVADAVAHAHRHLIVHRDLKPSNVLVTGAGAVKLLDFGIAKLLDASAEAAPTETLVRGLTPQYAAPEQLLGQPVTTATDVYALGLLLYVLLAGRHPFESAVQAAATGRGGELVQAVVNQTAPLASTVAVASLARRALEGDLDNILAKTLEKDPADRYASVGALAEDLQRFLAQEPVQARPITTGYRLRKFVGRHRMGVATALAIAAALIGTSVLASWQMLEARAERDHALTEAQRAQAQADLTEFVIGDSLSRIPGDAVRARLDRAREFIATRYRRSPLLAAQLLIDVSGRYIDIGEDRTAAEVDREVEAINQGLHDPDLTAQLACLHAEDLALTPDVRGASAQLTIGLASLAQLRTVRPQTEAECADAAALVLQDEGDHAQAVARLTNARRDLVRSGMFGASRYTSTTNNLARAMLLQGDYRGAWRMQSELLALMRSLGRANTAAWWPLINNSCRALLGGGKPRRALELVDAALAAANRETPTFQPPYMVVACRAAASVLAGEAAAADPELVRATRAAEAAGALAASKFYSVMTVVSAISAGDLAAADARWAVLQPQEERALAAHDGGVEAVRLMLAHVRLDLAHGRDTSLMQRLDLASRLIAARGQPINSDAYDVRILAAQASMQLGDYAEAERQASAAFEIARAGAVDPSSSAWVGEAVAWRARAERALGKAATAQASAQECLRHLEANLLPGSPLLAAVRSEFPGTSAVH
jgi:eukaryotic-like serine/threonine-protein kinase